MFGHNSSAAELFGIRLLSGIFGKKRLNARGFAREYLCFCSGYGPGQHQLLGGSISLKLSYNPSLLILWMTRWGFRLKNYNVS